MRTMISYDSAGAVLHMTSACVYFGILDPLLPCQGQNDATSPSPSVQTSYVCPLGVFYTEIEVQGDPEGVGLGYVDIGFGSSVGC